MGFYAVLVSSAVVILVAGWLAIRGLVSARSHEAVLEEKVKETQANAEALANATKEIAKHVDRDDVVSDLRNGVF